jgi:hypothetical protein
LIEEGDTLAMAFWVGSVRIRVSLFVHISPVKQYNIVVHGLVPLLGFKPHESGIKTLCDARIELKSLC